MIGKTNPDDTRLIQDAQAGIEFRGSRWEPKIRQLFGNSLNFDFTPYQSKMDLVFVDGAHHYETVASDTANGLKLLKPGGYLVWHDFANFGDYHDVTRAVLDMLPGDEVYQIEDSQLALYRMPQR